LTTKSHLEFIFVSSLCIHKWIIIVLYSAKYITIERISYWNKRSVFSLCILYWKKFILKVHFCIFNLCQSYGALECFTLTGEMCITRYLCIYCAYWYWVDWLRITFDAKVVLLAEGWWSGHKIYRRIRTGRIMIFGISIMNCIQSCIFRGKSDCSFGRLLSSSKISF